MPEDLPPRLLEFIRQCIPTLQAAEVLLLLASHPDRRFSPEEAAAEMRPLEVTAAAFREYATGFERAGVVRAVGADYAYAPHSSTIEDAVESLQRAYNERPVTLVRAIYRLADSAIQSFSEAFKLRDDE